MSGVPNVAKLLEDYSFIPKICALRFCNEANFDDFVQEGILSLLERSSRMYNSKEDFVQVVVRNCLREQLAYYLRNYKDDYSIFEHPDIEANNLCCTLFGPSVKISSISESDDTDYYETKEIVRSIADNCSSKLKYLLYQLYRLG